MEGNFIDSDSDLDSNLDLDCSFGSDLIADLSDDLKSYEDCGTDSDCEINSNVSDDDEEDGLSERMTNFRSELRKWCILFAVSRDCMDALLSILFGIGLLVPKSTKTLLKTTAHQLKPKDMPPGRFINFGIENMLTKINHPSLRDADEIVVTVSSDGVPLYKSSKTQLIPMTINILGVKNMPQIPIGIYHGVKKPSLKEYLKDYCSEVPKLIRDGVSVTSEKVNKPFSVLFYSGDAPQRAWLAGVKGHTAKNGCHMCDQVASKIGNRLTYSTKRGNPRTDVSFALRSCPDHHQPHFLNEPTPLEEIGTGMVSQIPLDPMHLIDRGVSSKSLKALWENDICAMKITEEIKNQMESKIFEIRKFIPKDFPRKCRTFTEISHWKATEFRLFALYTSVVILRDSVSSEVYDHFLHLVCGYRLICTKDAQLNADTADTLFERFVENYPYIYGENRISYNVHNLLHICECVKRYGGVDEFSAYKNENYLQQLRKFVRKPTQMLEQVRNRVIEMCEINDIVYNKGFLFGTSNKFPDCTKSYKGYRFDKFVLQANRADACCQVFPDIKFEIEQFAMQNNEEVVIGRRFLEVKPFFTLPMNSEEVGIFQCSKLSSRYETFPVSQIQNKFVKLPYQDSSVLIAMLHHL